MPWTYWMISIAQASVMFTIGLSLTGRDFRKLADQPRALSLGLVLQFVLLPLIAWGVALLYPIEETFAVGLIILALCPGGSLSNFISYLVRADTALSVSITFVNSFIVLLTIPYFTNLALEVFMQEHQQITLSALDTMKQIGLVLMVPMLAGMGVRHLMSTLAQKIERPLSMFNLALLAVVFSVKFFADSEQGGSGITKAEIVDLLPPTLLLHLLSMISAYLIAKWLLDNKRQPVAIGIEVGLQNTTLALLIASAMLANEDFAKPTLTYALFSFFTTVAFALYTRPSKRPLRT